MIRVAAILYLMASPTLAEDLVPAVCGKVWDRLTSDIGAGLPVTGTATPTDRAGCLFTGLRLDLAGDYVPDWYVDRLYVDGSLPWLAGEAAPPDRLDVQAEGLRVVVQTGQPQMDWLFDAQSRPSAIDAKLSLAWDPVEKALRLEGLSIDFPGDNLVQASALVTGVDLSSVGAMQMSATSFAITEADLTLQMHGLFEWYVLMAVGPAVLPIEGDMDAAAEDLRAALLAAVAELPATTVPEPSKSALVDLINTLPNPWGKLEVALRSAAGIGPARLTPWVITGIPASLAEAAPVLDGVQLDIRWTPTDAP
ncbi:MAG: hypothetical protein MUE52_07570 [Tabrizicola sp.]|jgi:hypothetical protein|nr:hypothetical protein [Tabrizicola sp.]